jgi:hypothetical protein
MPCLTVSRPALPGGAASRLAKPYHVPLSRELLRLTRTACTQVVKEKTLPRRDSPRPSMLSRARARLAMTRRAMPAVAGTPLPDSNGLHACREGENHA